MFRILDEKTNPALGSLLGRLRDRQIQQDRAGFRQRMRLVGTLLAYEIAATLEGETVEISTPLGERPLVRLAGSPIVGTALRAGLPFFDGFLEVFPESDTMFFGAARVEGALPDEDGGLPIDLGYHALLPTEGRDLIIADPMVATGSTILDIWALLQEKNLTPRRFIVAGLVGWRGAWDRLSAAIPGVELWLATCDEDLNEHGYIVPGLGDAGDLCFGPKI